MTWQQFLKVSRPPTLMATVVPLLVGGALAIKSHHFALWAWVDIFVIALIMQIGANMLNEYFDYKRGLDDHESLGIGGIIVTGEVRPETVWYSALIIYAIALVLGLILVAFRGPILLAMGLMGIIAGFLYTGTSHPISSTPFGEVLVTIIMGPIEVLSTQFAAGDIMTRQGVLLSIPVGISVATILLANNLRDYVKDRNHGRRTLPIVLGQQGGYFALNIMIAIILGWITVMVFFGSLPLSALLVWLALPLVVKSLSALHKPDVLPKAVPLIGRIHVLIGILLTVGILW